MEASSHHGAQKRYLWGIKASQRRGEASERNRDVGEEWGTLPSSAEGPLEEFCLVGQADSTAWEGSTKACMRQPHTWKEEQPKQRHGRGVKLQEGNMEESPVARASCQGRPSQPGQGGEKPSSPGK